MRHEKKAPCPHSVAQAMLPCRVPGHGTNPRTSQTGCPGLGALESRARLREDDHRHISPSFAISSRAKHKGRVCRHKLLDVPSKYSGIKIWQHMDFGLETLCHRKQVLYSSPVILTFDLSCARSSGRSTALSCSFRDKNEEKGKTRQRNDQQRDYTITCDFPG